MRLPVPVGVFDWNLPAPGSAKLIEVLQAQKVAPRFVVYGDDRSDLPRLSTLPGAPPCRTSLPRRLLYGQAAKEWSGALRRAAALWRKRPGGIPAWR